MDDKEKLKIIKRKAQVFNTELREIDMEEYVDWLIEQAEKVEQLQQEIEKEQKRLRNQIYETVEEKFLLEKQLRQAQAKAERYKQALEFYADENNYFVDISKLELPEDIFYAEPPIVNERGIKARKALEEKE